MRATLADLPPDYGEVLTTKYLDEVSVEQMARRERCTEAAIRSRLARARAAFKESFLRTAGSSEMHHRSS